MFVIGMGTGAFQSGLDSYLNQRNSGFAVDWGTVGKETLKGGVLSGIAGGVGGVMANVTKPLSFCGKGAMEIAGDVLEHWAVGTVGDAGTTMLTTYVSDRMDGKSPQEAFQNVMSSADDILVDSMWTSAAGTLVDSVTAPKCFVAGTMVVTAGGLVAIENIQPGDVVLAANEETGEVAYKEVVRTFVNTTDEITHVTIENAEGEQETIDSTPEHPFYVEGLGWVEASSLHTGMTIWFANGTKGTVEDISNEGLEEPVTVYNFEVKDFHTYFVGESGVLVHNVCEVTWPEKPHTNKTEGHWETIQETAITAAKEADVVEVYVNKGLSNVIDNPPHNNRPDVTIVHENGKIDMVEVMSKTDNVEPLKERLYTNAGYLGDNAGTLTIKTPQGKTVWTSKPGG